MHWLIFTAGFIAGQIATFVFVVSWWAIRSASDDYPNKEELIEEINKLWAELEYRKEPKRGQ